jgi:peptide/nickel transport system permease protein
MLVGLLGIVVFVVIAIGGQALAPYDYRAVDIPDRLTPPSATHAMGTDQFGRDLFSRILVGARVSLIVGVFATLIGAVAGLTVGAVSGYAGGWTDELAMRGLDIVLAFPQIILAIALAALLGPSLGNVVLIVGVLSVPQFARVLRGSVLAIKNQEFVVAAQAVGVPERRILFRHILPNTLGPAVVLASVAIPGAITSEAALSFLGLGIQPPQPSWGNLLADGRQYLLQAPWLAVFPGVAITLAVLAFNFAGDGLRDALDPRLAR